MQRISWIDRWRGLLIVSIVMFHVVGIGMISCSGCLAIALGIIKTFISAYHVASFFVIAAILFPQTELTFGLFLEKKLMRLLIPYVVFGGLMVVVFYFSKSYTGDAEYYSTLGKFAWYDPLLALMHGGGWPQNVGARVLGPLWFLPCFFSSQVFFYLINKVCDNALKWLCAAAIFLLMRVICVYIAYDFNPFGIGMALEYVAIMCVFRGIVVKKDYMEDWRLPFKFFIPALVFVVIGCLKSIALPSVAAVFNRTFASIFAIIGSAMMAKIITVDILAFVGRYSIGIFLIHKFVLVFLQAITCNMAFCFRNGIAMGLFSVVGITCIVVVVSIVITRVVRRIAPFTLGEKHVIKKRKLP